METSEKISPSLKELYPLIRNIQGYQDQIEKASEAMVRISRQEKNAREIVQLWADVEAERMSDKGRLALFYLVNDVIHKSQGGADS